MESTDEPSAATITSAGVPNDRTTSKPRRPIPLRWWDWISGILAFIGLAGIGLLAFYSPQGINLAKILQAHVFWVLAPLPGLTALCHFLFYQRPRYDRRSQVVDDWLKRTSAAAPRTPDREHVWNVDGEQLDASIKTIRPSFGATLFGAVLLSLVFSIAAASSSPPTGIGIQFGNPARLSGTAQPPGTTTPTSAVPKAADVEQAGTTSSPTAMPMRPTSPRAIESEGAANVVSAAEPTKGAASVAELPKVNSTADVSQGLRGLVYATYGSYIYVCGLIISRINMSSLSGKLLIRLALRSASSLVLGFAAGELGLFVLFATPNQSLFFYLAIGLFPLLALDSFRKQARSLFAPTTLPADAMPVCMIDGIDDDITDALAENGIWEIQHLATASPVDMLLSTSFPPNRILDWLDQAMLITYVREKVPVFRTCGIRGAIDLAVLHMDLGNADKLRAERAARLLDTLSQKSGYSVDTIVGIARSLYEDGNVQIIWDLWQTGGVLQSGQ